MPSISILPRLMLHGIGVFGMDTVQQIIVKVLKKPGFQWGNKKLVQYAANLAIGATTLLENTISQDHPILSCISATTNQPLKSSNSLFTLLNKHYGNDIKQQHTSKDPQHPLRIDLFIANPDDPLVIQWLPRLLEIPRPPNTLRVLIYEGPKNIIDDNTLHLLDAFLEIPNPSLNLHIDEPLKSSNSIVTLLLRLIEVLALPSMVNIDFRDLFNLLQMGGPGLARTTRFRAGRAPSQAIDKLFIHPFSKPMSTINKAIIAISGTTYTIHDLNDLLDRCRQHFSRDIELKWGTTSKLPKRIQGYNEILVIGIAKHDT